MLMPDNRYSGNFNPRSREGSDVPVSGGAYQEIYFNPRSREGSDAIASSLTLELNISIRAPAKGATDDLKDWTEIAKFQSALPRRERPANNFNFLLAH